MTTATDTTTPAPITVDDALAALRAAVEAKGGHYVYPKRPIGVHGRACVYATDDGQPSCLAGYVLAALAPDILADVADRERTERGFGADIIDNVYPGRFAADVAIILGIAQRSQDAGNAWAVALADAEREAAELAKEDDE